MNKLQTTHKTNQGYDQGAALVVAIRKIVEFLVSFVNGAIAEAKR